jgi:hypothetical protein
MEECDKCGCSTDEYEVIFGSVYCDDCVEESDNRQDEKDNSSCYTANIV